MIPKSGNRFSEKIMLQQKSGMKRELIMDQATAIRSAASAAPTRTRTVTWEDPLLSARAGLTLSGGHGTLTQAVMGHRFHSEALWRETASGGRRRSVTLAAGHHGPDDPRHLRDPIARARWEPRVGQGDRGELARFAAQPLAQPRRGQLAALSRRMPIARAASHCPRSIELTPPRTISA